MNHKRLSRLSPAEAREELVQSRAVLAEKLGAPPVSFAHPYGDGADLPWLRALLQEAGYRSAVSVHQGKADWNGDPLCLHRIFVRGDDTAWDFHLNLTRGRARL
jgi:peptidoglycan/xylan/chitin deacetylase (PgdA/CDA1 family)